MFPANSVALQKIDPRREQLLTEELDYNLLFRWFVGLNMDDPVWDATVYCAAILRGGSYYRPQGSLWYSPQAYKLNEHTKYLLMAPSIDRSATIGFRCVVDSR